MKIDSNSLLNTCLEIEGLLCLVSRRGSSVPENVGVMLVEKASRLKESLIEFTSHAPEDDEDEDSIACSAILEEVNDAGQQPEVSVAESLDNETVNLTASVEAPAVAMAQDKAAEIVVEPEPDDVLVETVAEVETENVTPVPAEPVQPVRNDVAPVELTINDKFRFRRELFGNSDVDLAEALQVASQMSTVEEVEEYFYNDLCFDPADDAVKDFIRVVTSKH